MVTRKSRPRYAWIIWSALTAILALTLLSGISFRRMHSDEAQSQVRALFSPAKLSTVHAQIELQCPACHGMNPFPAATQIQEACTHCHIRDEFNKAADTHRLSLFEGGANADRFGAIDASQCVTCHAEHPPAAEFKPALAIPQDFCIACHRDVAQERQSHQRLKFDSCLNSGCHNYHDNRSLYESFLVKQSQRPVPTDRTIIPIQRATAPDSTGLLHNPHMDSSWHEQPCADCHSQEALTYAQGKHGMRTAAGLAAMSPGLSHLSFRKDALGKPLSCTSCHSALKPDLKAASVEACASCHNDAHTLAYQGSPHDIAWRRELRGETPPGSGVSCATCHLARKPSEDGSSTFASHNPNEFLRPRSRQIRTVCLSCHSLSFSIDALADEALIRSNFRSKPSRHVASIDMAIARKNSAEPDNGKEKK